MRVLFVSALLSTAINLGGCAATLGSGPARPARDDERAWLLGRAPAGRFDRPQSRSSALFTNGRDAIRHH
jgi:hypothetical protein